MPIFRIFLICIAISVFGGLAYSQADDICQEFGETPSREVGRDNRLVPFIYGRIVVRGLTSNAKKPRITVTYSDTAQPANRQVLGRSGNYCFPKRGTGGTIIVESDGVEMARKSVSDIGTGRMREDFEIFVPEVRQSAAPAVVNTKFARPPNQKTAELYQKGADAEGARETVKAIEAYIQVVAIDAEDYIAWTKIGTLQIEINELAGAEKAFQRALILRKDYTPAMLSLGILMALQNRNMEAINMFERAVIADPNSARTYRYLGEVYLQARRGNDGLAALDEALRLDPIGMAECHLLKARLYDLAGAKSLASGEYKAFLKKVPEYPEKKNLEKYIKDNPDQIKQ